MTTVSVRPLRAWAMGLAALAALAAGGPAAAAPNTGRLSLLLGNDFTTAYFFRGIVQERRGFITQPYAEVGLKLYEGKGPLSGVSLFGGTWHSIHSERTGAVNDPEVLYETDWYGGLQLTLFDKLTSRVFYTAYTSPNDAFATVQEADFSFALDDSDLLGAFALAPSLFIGVETENTAFGPKSGTYIELGAGPGLDLVRHDTYPVNLSFPLKVGLSGKNYYERENGANESFGYFSGGLKLGVPLAFVPEDYGSWSATAGVNFLVLGRTTGAANNEHFWTVGTWGISMTY